MELKLNVYNKKEIVKTYTADTYDLEFGTVEDICEIIDLDKLETGTDAEIIKLVGGAVISGMGIIKPLLKDMFEGLTDEELRHTKAKDVASVLVATVKYAIEEINKGASGKN